MGLRMTRIECGESMVVSTPYLLKKLNNYYDYYSFSRLQASTCETVPAEVM